LLKRHLGIRGMLFSCGRAILRLPECNSHLLSLGSELPNSAQEFIVALRNGLQNLCNVVVDVINRPC
jgi:hypothetical protein